MKSIIRRLFFAVLLITAPFVFAASGTLTANGDTGTVILTRPHVHVSGDFGSGTITFYFKDGNGGWRAIEGAAFTSADDVVLEFERPTSIKGTLGSSTSPALIWSIEL